MGGWISVIASLIATILLYGTGHSYLFFFAILITIACFLTFGIMHNYATSSAKSRHDRILENMKLEGRAEEEITSFDISGGASGRSHRPGRCCWCGREVACGFSWAAIDQSAQCYPLPLSREAQWCGPRPKGLGCDPGNSTLSTLLPGVTVPARWWKCLWRGCNHHFLLSVRCRYLLL